METANGRGQIGVFDAAFLGVGAMVGAGIFALLGEAGTIAGSAVWLSFLIAGVIAMLQGYSFVKLGTRYPSQGGTIEFLVQGFGNGHVTGIVSWLFYVVGQVITVMVALSFGSYAGDAVLWRRRRARGNQAPGSDHHRGHGAAQSASGPGRRGACPDSHRLGRHCHPGWVCLHYDSQRRLFPALTRPTTRRSAPSSRVSP